METVVTCKLRLRTEPEHTERLLATARAYRDALNFVWRENFLGNKSTGMKRIHRDFYAICREEFGLPSQHAIDVNRETRAMFSTLWTLQKKEFSKPPKQRKDHFRHVPVRRSLSMQLTLNRNVSVFPDSGTVSVTALDGRIKHVPFSGCGKHVETMRSGRMGDPKLLYDSEKRRFYLLVPVTVEALGNAATETVAIDVGERHIAAVVSTEGRRDVIDLPENYAEIKSKIHGLRGALRSKGTRSARRHLRRLARRERLFTSDAVHRLSKRIVVEHPHAVVVMEDLTDIREDRVTYRSGEAPEDRREARRRAEQWPFAMLQARIAYKHALLNGGRTEFVDPAYTSRRCPQCGHVAEGNRTRDVFACLSCGHSDHADLVAGDNLLYVFANGPIVNRPDAVPDGDRGVAPPPKAGSSKPTILVVGS